jgi:hypothetical protein
MSKMFCNPDDPASCLCCGQDVRQRKRNKKKETAEAARLAIEHLEALGYTKEEMLGPYKAHLDWQMPGFAEWVRRSLS